MNQYLEFINEKIGLNLEGQVVTFEYFNSQFIMRKEASIDEIENCEIYFNWKLPQEYKNFLQKYNGGVLFKIDDFAGFKLLATEELIKHNEFQKLNFGQDWDSEIILFCECIGDAEYLGFKLTNKISIVHCIMDTLPLNWNIIENSFEVFVTKLIEKKGQKYWLE